jgi:hypothetical protein
MRVPLPRQPPHPCPPQHPPPARLRQQPPPHRPSQPVRPSQPTRSRPTPPQRQTSGSEQRENQGAPARQQGQRAPPKHLPLRPPRPKRLLPPSPQNLHAPSQPQQPKRLRRTWRPSARRPASTSTWACSPTSNARKAQSRLLNEGLPAFRQTLDGAKGTACACGWGPMRRAARQRPLPPQSKRWDWKPWCSASSPHGKHQLTKPLSSIPNPTTRLLYVTKNSARC